MQSRRSDRISLASPFPAADVKRLLMLKPKDVLGLAVPGMPSGSPGMETPGKSDRYDVIAFNARGKTRVFASHG